MDDDFDNEIGLPDDEIGGSADDLADVGMGGIEGELEPGAGEGGGTRSSGGARARQSTPTPRAAKAAAPAKKASKPKAVEEEAGEEGREEEAEGQGQSEGEEEARPQGRRTQVRKESGEAKEVSRRSGRWTMATRPPSIRSVFRGSPTRRCLMLSFAEVQRRSASASKR